jgi:UTP--glucose-1-phosphate uridylyltransferase
VTATVRKAVIPAAGLGTRFLPATKAQPKEMLPVVDKPAIQYVVEEAVRAGITDVLIVTSRNKASIEDHFDRHLELEDLLAAKGKTDSLAEVRALADLAHVHFVRQGEPLGLGHAVGVARSYVGDEPFAVLLPDDLMIDDSALLSRMLATYRERNKSVLALKEYPPEEIGLYGSLRPEPVADGLVRVHDVVEKPPPGTAPSNLAIMGRYVFGPEIFSALTRTEPGVGGEIQLTDAFALLAAEDEVFGVIFSEGRYDAGSKLDYLRATVELALVHPELGPAFREVLAGVVDRQRRSP